MYNYILMTTYHPAKIHLTEHHLKSLAHGIHHKKPVTIQIAHNHLSGPHDFLLTKRQMNAMEKAKHMGKGLRITLSPQHLHKLEHHGGFISMILPWLSRLLPMASRIIPTLSKAIPTITKVAKVAGPALAFGALSSAASNAVDRYAKPEGSGLISYGSGSKSRKRTMKKKKALKTKKASGLYQFGEKRMKSHTL